METAEKLLCSPQVRTSERVSISAFVDSDDHERLAERARDEDRSLSAELRVAIREHLREQVAQRDDPTNEEDR
jgi:post-segregation antitoxin (ccd killing protein)